MESAPLRSFRGLGAEPTSCSSASELELGPLVRALTRSLVAVSAYDAAIVSYCRRYFDDAGNDDFQFRHDVCQKLRGPISFSVLWAIFLDSDRFRKEYADESGRHPPSLRDRNTEPSPSFYADFVREMKTTTLIEDDSKDTMGALGQQTRLILRKAKEVDLVEYEYVHRVKSLTWGTENLFRFFREELVEKMDRT